MDIELFDFALPEELIAQSPMEQRDECRLLVVNREKKTIEHKHFHGETTSPAHSFAGLRSQDPRLSGREDHRRSQEDRC